MSSLKLKTPSGGSVSFNAEDTGTDLTLTVPARTGNVHIDGPAFSAYMSAAQTFTASTWTKIVFDTEEFDTNSNYDITNYRFTPTVAGYYQVNISFKVESVTSRGIVALYKNGSYYKFGDDIQGTYLRNITGSFLVYLNGSTDYIEAYGYQGNGTSNAVSQTFQTHFSGYLVRGV